jgi:hypothetical protein
MNLPASAPARRFAGGQCDPTVLRPKAVSAALAPPLKTAGAPQAAGATEPDS